MPLMTFNMNSADLSIHPTIDVKDDDSGDEAEIAV
jgi:hypothetical protein